MGTGAKMPLYKFGGAPSPAGEGGWLAATAVYCSHRGITGLSSRLLLVHADYVR